MLLVMILVLIPTVATEFCESRQRPDIMWYFDEQFQSCFAYPVNCTASMKIIADLYPNDEECTLKHMKRMWKTYTISCPHSLELAVFNRSNGDQVPYIFSPLLCRKIGRRTVSDVCTSSESCYAHREFAFCCNNRAFSGSGTVGGKFTFSGIGGSKWHIASSVVTSTHPVVPTDCNSEGDRRSVEWYPRSSMACVARRADCRRPWFPVDLVNTTYKSQQQCMDAHFANWMMSYNLTCTEGHTPVTVDGVGLIFSKTLCGSMHHSDMCNRDEYCVFSRRSPYAFCCRRSESNPRISYAVHGYRYRRPRTRRQIKFVSVE